MGFRLVAALVALHCIFSACSAQFNGFGNLFGGGGLSLNSNEGNGRPGRLDRIQRRFDRERRRARRAAGSNFPVPSILDDPLPFITPSPSSSASLSPTPSVSASSSASASITPSTSTTSSARASATPSPTGSKSGSSSTTPDPDPSSTSSPSASLTPGASSTSSPSPSASAGSTTTPTSTPNASSTSSASPSSSAGSTTTPSSTPSASVCPDAEYASVKQAITAEAQTDEEWPARLLRAGFHDCIPGACDGSLANELGREENKRLTTTINLLTRLTSGSCVSVADAIKLGIEVSMEVSGGPSVSCPMGTVDIPDLENPTGQLAGRDNLIERLLEIFTLKGFSVDQAVAATIGGHSLGRFGSNPFTPNQNVFDNSFASFLLDQADGNPTLSGFNSLPSDKKYVLDADTRLIVERYAADENELRSDFQSFLNQMCAMSGPITASNSAIPTPSSSDGTSPTPSASTSLAASASASFSPSPSEVVSGCSQCTQDEFCDQDDVCQAIPSPTPSCAGVCCCGASQYCDGSGCISVTNWSPIATNAGVTFTAPYSQFNIQMISDVQFWYKGCKDGPREFCVFDKYDGQGTKIDILEAAVARFAACSRSLALSNSYSVIIDGGDITNNGDPDQLNRYNTFLGELPGVPKAVVLGNHDYYEPEIPSAINSARLITFLKDQIVSLSNINSGIGFLAADFEEAEVDVQGVATRFVRGSLMYSFEIEGVVFIAMHWAPALKGARYVHHFGISENCPGASCETISGKPEFYEMTDGYLWLEAQLKSAAGKSIVLVPHYVRALEKYLQRPTASESRSILKNQAIAVLTGHDHDQWGKYGTMTISDSTALLEKDSDSGIPVHYAGSASYERFITVRFNAGAVPVVDIYKTSEEDPCSTTDPDNDD